MRGLWLAAVATMMGCAGQAAAARFLEIQVAGETGDVRIGNDPTRSYIVSSTVHAVFDTSMREPYANGSDFTLVLGSADLSSGGSLVTIAHQRAGTSFNISFAGVPESNSLQQIAGSGTYGYTYCPSSCAGRYDGRLVYVLARLTDLAPGPTGYDEQLRFTAVGVPEPASWAMMLLGTGVVGAGARRRRRAAYA